MRNNNIDTDQVSEHLNRVFQRATRGMKKNTKGTKLYDLQVEFCYYLNNIQRGPKYIIPKIIADCNEFIRETVVPTVESSTNK